MKTDNIFRSLFKLRLLQHFAFWLTSIIVLTYLFKVSAQPAKIDVIFALIFHIPLWITVYLNLYILIPWLLRRNRYTGYGLGVIVLASGMAFFYQFLFNHLIDHILKGYFFISYFEYRDYILFLAGYILITTLIKLARGWFHLSEIESEKRNMELQLIKSQVNPHFLFNTLNTLYSEALNKDETLPASILNLSDMLRYSLYESGKPFVSAAKEADFISAYFKLQEKRFNNNNSNIDLRIVGKFDEMYIPPLVLLPFVENCFKHLSVNEKGSFFIHIIIRRHKNALEFVAENSFNEEERRFSKGGLGVDNALRRLDLLYKKNSYNFEKYETQSVYRVRLVLKSQK
ncbi:sensor histidine kinase [Saccharicrinis sp. FJH54]|uniref:sensor histidine kinase n=1 Tax=Saccharicrinis sp. FJH54 TaxID=3344665 RepID=UPI0035D4F5C2